MTSYLGFDHPGNWSLVCQGITRPNLLSSLDCVINTNYRGTQEKKQVLVDLGPLRGNNLKKKQSLTLQSFIYTNELSGSIIFNQTI